MSSAGLVGAEDESGCKNESLFGGSSTELSLGRVSILSTGLRLLHGSSTQHAILALLFSVQQHVVSDIMRTQSYAKMQCIPESSSDLLVCKSYAHLTFSLGPQRRMPLPSPPLCEPSLRG